jgi:RNA polymerase sigma-70 factor, Bacteroides expansion family 1
VKSSNILYENVLLKKFKEGDKSAFSSIFLTYYKDLVMFASTITKDSDTSEEIVQNVFVKLWEDRESISITTSLKSYLLKTVQNSSIDWLRHLKIRDKYSSNISKNSVLEENDTENYVLYSELEQHIEKVLAQLPAEIAESFMLNRYDGLKYYEIAEKLDVSVRTVEVRIGKALHLLREQLKDYVVTIVVAFIGWFW